MKSGHLIRHILSATPIRFIWLVLWLAVGISRPTCDAYVLPVRQDFDANPHTPKPQPPAPTPILTLTRTLTLTPTPTPTSNQNHNPKPDQVSSYAELYEAKLKQQDQAIKELRERQHSVQENRGPNMKQVKLYKGLAKLLRCKQDMQKAARAEVNQMAEANQQDTNVFTMPDEQADPL